MTIASESPLLFKQLYVHLDLKLSVDDAKQRASLGCTAEPLQDQGDWNVKQPATALSTPHYCLYSSTLKQGLPGHTSFQNKQTKK